MKKILPFLIALSRAAQKVTAPCLRLLPVATLILCLACGAKGPAATTELDQLADPAATEYNALEVAELNGKLYESFTATPIYEDYVIGGGDLIELTIFEAPDLSIETRVSARGSVTLPLLSTVRIAGLSVLEAERHVEELYREKYLQDPHITIFVKEQFGSKITMMGALKKPGTYDFYASMNLMDVLAMAEGLSDAAGRTVQIRRKPESSEDASSLVIDLDQLVKGGQGNLNVGIKGGDVIYVPEAGSVYVDGAVRKAGSYPIRKEMSVQEAIVAAGGLQSFADAKNVKLIRYLGEGRREVAKLSLAELQTGETGKLKVRDRDVIFVESSAVGTFVQGLRLTLGAGLFGVGYTPPSQ
ncbi:SLBB domain-containing protein [Desulfomicrobium sp. ZS1]|jgi:polysaccharide export outer membrane protein|uniref:polysaccharide biosynthesis/export family protein n=1 Tax=Desulfomicrobium sp. ZS1 TaxID=2952228 RepID=UPI0020B3368D|nr:polysaccharide biosynthesis/export family protein [Desulfomicrobium sp. ZS1]UTF51322.1 SLBB domain-containing protein [Desulfomicrobium sp. ZS1]